MEVLLTRQAAEELNALISGKKADLRKARKVRRTLELLAVDTRYPGLNSHRFESFDDLWGAAVWESYIENRTPAVWRIWWFFGPVDGVITVVKIAAHP